MPERQYLSDLNSSPVLWPFPCVQEKRGSGRKRKRSAGPGAGRVGERSRPAGARGGPAPQGAAVGAGLAAQAAARAGVGKRVRPTRDGPAPKGAAVGAGLAGNSGRRKLRVSTSARARLAARRMRSAGAPQGDRDAGPDLEGSGVSSSDRGAHEPDSLQSLGGLQVSPYTVLPLTICGV